MQQHNATLLMGRSNLYYSMPDIKRDANIELVIEQTRFKSAKFWSTVITKFGVDVFKLVKTDKANQYGSYYMFAADLPIATPTETQPASGARDAVLAQVIPVNVKLSNTIMSRASVRKDDVSLLIYKSKQTREDAKLGFDVIQMLSCIQYKLCTTQFAHDKLVFPYTPLSTKATNTGLVPHKDPFIKLCVSVGVAPITTPKGTFDMNTVFTKFIPDSGKFCPSKINLDLNTVVTELTDGSIGKNMHLDLSNVHIPTGVTSYVSFKASLRDLQYVHNPNGKSDCAEVHEDDEMFAEMMALSNTKPLQKPCSFDLNTAYPATFVPIPIEVEDILSTL